jgi:hypothetical protein
VRSRLDSIEQHISLAKSRIEELDRGQISELQTQMQDIVHEQTKLSELQMKIDQTQHEKSVLVKNVESLKSRMEVYQGKRQTTNRKRIGRTITGDSKQIYNIHSE